METNSITQVMGQWLVDLGMSVPAAVITSVVLYLGGMVLLAVAGVGGINLLSRVRRRHGGGQRRWV